MDRDLNGGRGIFLRSLVDIPSLKDCAVMDTVLRNGVLMGVDGAERLSGAAILSFSGAKEEPQGLNELQESVWAALGKEARSRYEAVGKAKAQFKVESPHIFRRW